MPILIDHQSVTRHISSPTGKEDERRTLSYVTWNRTSLPLPNGSRNRSVTAATIAQKKLCALRTCQPQLRMEEPKPLPPPHDLCRKEVRHFFETEQDAADGRAEGNGHPGRTRSTEDPATLACSNASTSGSYGRCVYSPSFVSYLLKNLLTMLPTQEAMWTKGPSLPVKGQSDVNFDS